MAFDPSETKNAPPVGPRLWWAICEEGLESQAKASVCRRVKSYPSFKVGESLQPAERTAQLAVARIAEHP
jgi:hypothetical protein